MSEPLVIPASEVAGGYRKERPWGSHRAYEIDLEATKIEEILLKRASDETSLALFARPPCYCFGPTVGIIRARNPGATWNYHVAWYHRRLSKTLVEFQIGGVAHSKSYRTEPQLDAHGKALNSSHTVQVALWPDPLRVQFDLAPLLPVLQEGDAVTIRYHLPDGYLIRT